LAQCIFLNTLRYPASLSPCLSSACRSLSHGCMCI
jgi:hypothetical protein